MNSDKQHFLPHQLFIRQSHVAITFLAGHFPAKPPRRREFAARYEVGEFHLRHYQTGMFTAINVNLDHQISPRNVVPHLAQSSSRSGRPERCKLFWAELDLALFPVCPTANFESERRGFALFPKANMPASGLGGQITLRDLIMATVLQFIGQLPNQKFAFNFPVLCRATVLLHKVTC